MSLLSNTPYDDVFRTLLNDCSPLILPLINEVFDEHYTGREKIVFSPNEHFLNRRYNIFLPFGLYNFPFYGTLR